jgi:hypothetical protein
MYLVLILTFFVCVCVCVLKNFENLLCFLQFWHFLIGINNRQKNVDYLVRFIIVL